MRHILKNKTVQKHSKTENRQNAHTIKMKAEKSIVGAAMEAWSPMFSAQMQTAYFRVFVHLVIVWDDLTCCFTVGLLPRCNCNSVGR
jgi:hypothetical protein